MADDQRSERRLFLLGVASGSAVVLTSCAAGRAGSDDDKPDEAEAEVTPGEDLMQEHGVVERILLVYGEVVRRLERNEAVDLSLVTETAGIVRRFVEDYHERNEEKHIFPRLEAAQREVGLVTTLRQQHQRGREVTDEIVRLAQSKASPELARLLGNFERMYRPHAAREDTVLFPAFRSIVGRHGYAELGEQFEDEEHARFGEHGFEDTVAAIARIESSLGILDLERFTAP
jgi:hemerythrin-like domain-containing protein